MWAYVCVHQVKIHGQSLESVYKEIPMRILPVEYLPDDYKGPNAGTEKEVIGDQQPPFSLLSLCITPLY